MPAIKPETTIESLNREEYSATVVMSMYITIVADSKERKDREKLEVIILSLALLSMSQ